MLFKYCYVIWETLAVLRNSVPDISLYFHVDTSLGYIGYAHVLC